MDLPGSNLTVHLRKRRNEDDFWCQRFGSFLWGTKQMISVSPFRIILFLESHRYAIESV